MGLIFPAALGLAACSQATQWRHPTLPADQWARDEAACRRVIAALRKVEGIAA